MDHALHWPKAASLVFLLAYVGGCATLASVPGGTDVSTTVTKGFQTVKEFVEGKPKPGGKEDKYCDAFEETSYEVTDNVVAIVLATDKLQLIQDVQQGRLAYSSTGKNAYQKIAEDVSKNYVWMPVSFEQALGNYLHERLAKDSKILDRNGKRNRTLYNKVDTALEKAKKDYTKLPYETKLYIIESEQINAEALPAGSIYITRQAASDLNDNALQLVLGHEIAHIAKRHTSKQIQQRLVESGLAADMLQHIIENRSAQGLEKFFHAERVIEAFHGTLAKYDQGQELQADACSIRGMLSAGTDPLKAREEYLRKRGTREATDDAKAPARKPFGLGFTVHPEDKDRDRFFQEAYQHHRQKQPQVARSLPVAN
jgi:predicted Zn-dependent protease